MAARNGMIAPADPKWGEAESAQEDIREGLLPVLGYHQTSQLRVLYRVTDGSSVVLPLEQANYCETLDGFTTMPPQTWPEPPMARPGKVCKLCRRKVPVPLDIDNPNMVLDDESSAIDQDIALAEHARAYHWQRRFAVLPDLSDVGRRILEAP